MPLDNFKKDPPGLWLIIQNSLPFSWLKNSLDQHDPSRQSIKTTTDLFSYIKHQCKLLKDREIEAKQTDNMFTGISADQQRKDTSATRDPARPNIHAITESNPQQVSSYLDYWQVGSFTLSCLSKLTLSQKADDTQFSNFPPLPPFKQREFRPGIPLSHQRYLSHLPHYVTTLHSIQYL